MKPSITCSVTGIEREASPRADGEPALPKGWKRIRSLVYSPEGIRQKFALRCITIPVASVVEGYEGDDWSVETCRSGWAAFLLALRQSCQQARFVLNWAIRSLAAADNEPLKKTERGWALPKFKAADVDLYGS